MRRRLHNDGMSLSGTGNVGMERALLAFCTAGRLGCISIVAVETVNRPWSWWELWPTPLIMIALLLESAVVMVAYWRVGRIGPQWLVAVDGVVLLAATWANSVVSTDPVQHTWGWWMLTYEITVIMILGIGIRRWWVLTLFLVPQALSIFLCVTVLVDRPPSDGVFDTSAVLANGTITWFTARTLRRSVSELEEARALARAREAELAEEKRRVTNAAALHDRVLQTLEVLSAGDWITDSEMRGHVAADANWLRRFVQSGPGRSADSLSVALDEVIADVVRLHGLLVERHVAQVDDLTDLSSAAVTAAAGGVREALTNVARHSGVRRAIVHGEATDEHVTITVLDRGCGFVPASKGAGLGIPISLRQRLAEVRGRALIHSEPGAGTIVEIQLRRGVDTPPLITDG